MNNHVLKSLWIGNQLSINEVLCLKSYLYHGHEFHLYVYEDVQNVPEGIILKDANNIIPSRKKFRDSYNTFTSFADWFRLKLIYELGGWWVDMDTVCVNELTIEAEYCFSSEWNYNLKDIDVSNTCFKSPQKAAYLRLLLDLIEIKIDSGKVEWGEIGVFLFRQKWPELLPLNQYMAKPIVFCPINYFHFSKLITLSDYFISPQTFTIHLWNEIWRRGYMDKNAIYHPESIYESLKAKYL